MATLSDLRDAIEDILDIDGAAAILQLNSNRRERAFEGYLFALLVLSVRNAGGTAKIFGVNTGENPAIVVFRGGPGRLGSHSQDFAYAVCELGTKSFEFHLDVQYTGTSGAVHEVDVSIYDHEAAEDLRDEPTKIARSSKLYAAFECKFYDSHLGTILGRTFVGLVSDCGSLRFKAFASNGPSPGLAKYFQPKNRPELFLRLTPLDLVCETRFVEFFAQEFRRWSSVS